MIEPPDPPLPGDRRAHPRRTVVVKEARCQAGVEVFFGYAANVSRGGLFISAVRRREPGDVHEIRFELPGVTRLFQCRAQVVWTRGYDANSKLSPGFGLRFLDLPEEDRSFIDDWVGRQHA